MIRMKASRVVQRFTSTLISTTRNNMSIVFYGLVRGEEIDDAHNIEEEGTLTFRL